MEEFVIDIGSTHISSQLECANKEAERLEKQLKDLKMQQRDVLLSYLQKVKPVVEQISGAGWSFQNEKVGVTSKRGPLLGRSHADPNILFFVNAKTMKLSILDERTGEAKVAHVEELFEELGFSEAMEQLEGLTRYYDDLINELRESLKQQRSSLSRYSS